MDLRFLQADMQGILSAVRTQVANVQRFAGGEPGPKQELAKHLISLAEKVEKFAASVSKASIDEIHAIHVSAQRMAADFAELWAAVARQFPNSTRRGAARPMHIISTRWGVLLQNLENVIQTREGSLPADPPTRPRTAEPTKSTRPIDVTQPPDTTAPPAG